MVYSFNTYFLLLDSGTLTLRAAFAFFPLVIYFYIKTIETKKTVFAIATTLTAFVICAYEPRAFYIMLWLIFIYFIYHLLIINVEYSLKKIRQIIFFGSLPVFLVILLNFFWLYSLSRIGALTQNALFDRSLFGNEFLNINYAITLFHPFWTGARLAIFNVQPIPVYFWLVPIFALLGLVLNKKNNLIVFFGIIALLGIFLTKQVAIPFTGIYLWLYKHLPGFNAFREASKFYSLIALGYSVLIAAFIDRLWDNHVENFVKRFGKYVLTVFVILLFVWNLKPLVTGEIGTLFVPRFVPQDYITAKNYILKQNDSFRTLWVPTYSRWSIYTNIYPRTSLADIIYSNWENLVESKKAYDNSSLRMMSFFNQPTTDNILNITNIKYVFVPISDKANDDNFFVYYGGSRQYYINELNKIKYLRKIDIGTKDLVVYENRNYNPHIYLTQEKETIKKDVRVKTDDLSFEFINPTEYKITLKNISKPVYLNFSESYHSSWNLRIGNFNWFDVLTKKNYFISDKYHFENDATLNSFYINPSTLCKEFVCRKNNDGSYGIDMTLYFAPQSYLYLGLIISGSTLVVVLAYLLFIFGKHILYARKN